MKLTSMRVVAVFYRVHNFSCYSLLLKSMQEKKINMIIIYILVEVAKTNSVEHEHDQKYWTQHRIFKDRGTNIEISNYLKLIKGWI